MAVSTEDGGRVRVCNTPCMRFECQEWVNGEQVRPSLVLRNGFWVCPKCCGSYGADPDSYDVPD